MSAQDASTDAGPGHGWSVGRRELFGLAGAALGSVVLAACGSSSGSPVRAVSTSGGSSSGGTAPATTTSSTAPTSSGPSSSVPAATPTAQVGGAHVTSGAITVSNAEREAGVANGTWRGGWHDSAGNSGTSDVTIAIDGSARTARASVAFTGALLGAEVPAQVYEVDLMSFVLLADSWTVTSPQFGTVTIVPGGDTEGSGTAHSVPGHPEITSISADATKSGRRVDLTYTIKHTSGSTVRGAMAWSASGAPATPHAVQ